MSEAGAAAAAPRPTDQAEAAAPVVQEALHAVLDKPSYRAFHSLPVEIAICVGMARPLLGDLLTMGPDAVIVLDRRIDDPVDIRVGDRVIARGELQELDDGSGRLGVRLTEIAGRSGKF